MWLFWQVLSFYIPVFLGALIVSTWLGWFAHFFVHLPFGRYKRFRVILYLKKLGDMHFQYHHSLYSRKTGLRSQGGYRLQDKSCNDVFAPLVTVFYILPLFFFEFATCLVIYLAYILYTYHIIQIHEFCHLQGHWLERFAFFRRIRELHDIHHLSGYGNYGTTPLSLLWDRVFGSYYGELPGRERQEKIPPIKS